MIDKTQPTLVDLIGQLHEVLYGSSWARNESPAVVWTELIEYVDQINRRLLASEAEVTALQVMLAARLQSLTDLAAALAEYDRLHDAFMNDTVEDVETAVRLTAPLPKAKDVVITAAREAVAGSTTAIEDDK